jgi:hypothetical protein
MSTLPQTVDNRNPSRVHHQQELRSCTSLIVVDVLERKLLMAGGWDMIVLALRACSLAQCNQNKTKTKQFHAIGPAHVSNTVFPRVIQGKHAGINLVKDKDQDSIVHPQ